MKTVCPLCNKIAFIKHTVSSYKYYFCNSCKTLFIHPIPSKKTIRDYYQKHFSYSAGLINEQLIRNRSKLILNKLIQLNPKGLEMLDIGSGYGFFLDEAEKKELNVTGVEPSKGFTAFNSNHNITIINDQFPTNELGNKKFDFITLIHVIEHMRNPKFIIQYALSLLNPDGILYIETPNVDSHLYICEQENYTFLTPPDHIWLFSQYSFLNLIPKQYAVLKKRTYSYPEHFMGILKKMLKQNNKIIKATVNNKQNKIVIKNSYFKSFKFVIFDLILSRLLYRLLNIHQLGSILELYINKKQFPCSI